LKTNLPEQEPSPKTEDQVEEDAEVLLQLGTDTQGVEMRARLMSASLLSDMESFKVLLGQEVV
jgi:Rab3 GTPase-activating protein catalytic subunit